MGGPTLAAILAPLLLLLGFAAPPGAEEDPLAEVRRHYLEAVHDAEAIGRGLRAIDALRASGRLEPQGPGAAALRAYRGALVTLRAKHALWPPARLRHLREGLELLDRAVAEHPAHPEVRCLRLMSCYYLPGVLGRGWSVREDFAALARLLPTARGDYPPELLESIARFVLSEGGLAATERRALEAALASVARE